MDEYLFGRGSPLVGLGFLQTSSFMVPRPVLEKIRFAIDAAHDDWDFGPRLSRQPRMKIETVPEVLAVLCFEEPRPSGTARVTWREAFAWIAMMRPIITRRAYGGFCLSTVGSGAATERADAASVLLLYRAFKYGSPNLWSIGTFVGLWVLPRDATGD